MAAAAAAWLQFNAAAAAALGQPGGGGGLTPDLAAAVDGATAQGLAPLVPAQLLAMAAAALHARLARLRDALAPLLAAPAAGTSADGAGEEEEAAAFTDGMEATLAETLRVSEAGDVSRRVGQPSVAPQ